MQEQKVERFEIRNIEDIDRVIKTVNDLQLKKITIVPLVFSEKIFVGNLEKLIELKNKDIEVNFQYEESGRIISIDEVIEDEKFLNNIVREIEAKDFSPLEKLIAVYDIDKGLKPYNLGVDKNGQEKYASSRGIYEILHDKDIVCVGFANFLENLCYRLNLNVVHYPLMGVYIDGHEILYAHIVDEKYGINGYYTLDPTLEHGGKIEIPNEFPFEIAKSQYESFMLTTSETKQKFINKGKDYPSIDHICLANDPIEVMDVLMGLKKAITFSYEIEFNVYEQIDSIIEINPNLANCLNKLKNPFYHPTEEDCIELFNKTRDKFNKKIDKEKLLEAIINVKKKIYKNFSEQDFEDMKMLYSLYPPFAMTDDKGNIISPLYADDYFRYAGRRYLQLKDLSEEIRKKQNPCLSWNHIRQYGKMAIDYGVYTEEDLKQYNAKTNKNDKNDKSDLKENYEK